MFDATRRAWCVLIGVIGLATAAFAAQPLVAPDEARAMRGVIEAQLAAFAVDDAERAFSYASPSIREMFGTADQFIAMVRGGYPVVYRPKSVGFLLPELMGRDAVQRVRLTDASGAAWLATYNMQRQADQSWRINGCVVTRDNGPST